MATQIQLRRGTTSQHSSFTGAAGEVTVDTDKDVAVVHDGSTSATATTLATADRMVINDAGTMVQVALSDLVTFLENGAVSGFDIDGGTF